MTDGGRRDQTRFFDQAYIRSRRKSGEMNTLPHHLFDFHGRYYGGVRIRSLVLFDGPLYSVLTHRICFLFMWLGCYNMEDMKSETGLLEGAFSSLSGIQP